MELVQQHLLRANYEAGVGTLRCSWPRRTEGVKGDRGSSPWRQDLLSMLHEKIPHRPRLGVKSMCPSSRCSVVAGKTASLGVSARMRHQTGHRPAERDETLDVVWVRMSQGWGIGIYWWAETLTWVSCWQRSLLQGLLDCSHDLGSDFLRGSLRERALN